MDHRDIPEVEGGNAKFDPGKHRLIPLLDQIVSNVSNLVKISLEVLGLMPLLTGKMRPRLSDGGVAFRDGKQQQHTSSPEAIVKQCEVFMKRNHLIGAAYGHNYSFNQPSGVKYSPSQWLWGA